jgi:hypothetical protein
VIHYSPSVAAPPFDLTVPEARGCAENRYARPYEDGLYASVGGTDPMGAYLVSTASYVGSEMFSPVSFLI